MIDRRPPRLLVKTLAVTFITAALLLIVVFVVVMMTVRGQVRRTVADNLESSQRLFAAIESREQHEMRAQAANLAENPTLKAAIDTYAAESRSGDLAHTRALLNTIAVELSKVEARIEADAVVIADFRDTTLASAGRLGHLWPEGRPIALARDSQGPGSLDGVIGAGNIAFRIVSVPLMLDDGTTIATLYVATALDQHFAQQLAELSRTPTAVVVDGAIVASTLPAATRAEFEARLPTLNAPAGTMNTADDSLAYQRLVQIGTTSIYAIASIDESARSTVAAAMRALALVALGATFLALLGSVWLAHLLSEPIGRLSSSIEKMAAERTFHLRLPLTGSSRELDSLTDTFNALLASVETAEAQTEAAYTGAIQALATALDARDQYTAGHSERVSVLSVAIARTLRLPDDDIEVIRLGALLHDIGKIGVPDEVLRKPGALTPSEYDTIKLHPVLGARILRSVPFLSRHIPIVELHHERPDGKGYPLGLRGDDIPLAARIVHVADAYDAMTSARAYRRALPADHALGEIRRCAGTEFHADIVGALATALPGVAMHAPAPVAEAVSG
jgi:putative nucleotidyltransferase with HDIG domain